MRNKFQAKNTNLRHLPVSLRVDWSTSKYVELVFRLLRNTLLTWPQLIALLSAEANLNTRTTDASTPSGSGLQTKKNQSQVILSLPNYPLCSALQRLPPLCENRSGLQHSCAQVKEDDDMSAGSKRLGSHYNNKREFSGNCYKQLRRTGGITPLGLQLIVSRNNPAS